ncbi:MAG: lipid-A-disaccharide synthase [Candidatus Hydrogenedentes bacterium]|nr:lipid-A-disaccharide synthase [Candidatus Hydrogenedentota bacterium]
MSRVFFVAGETSGDIHGANLIRALNELEPSINCVGLGGKQMAAAGMELRYDLAAQAIMGFSEVVRALPRIRRVFNETVDYVQDTRPDCLVAIDYPGFNLRLAKQATKLGIPVVYYISPQVWAWKRGRIKTIAKLIRKMLVILPFEEKMYREAGVNCVYVGHPLLDHIPLVPTTTDFRDECVVGLLPGSRAQEIDRLLGVMLDVAHGIREHYPRARFVAPCVDADRASQIKAEAGDLPLETAIGKTYDVLRAARFCLVASGTATLETALFGVPMVILYKLSPVNYWIARRLVQVDHIGMVNILAGRRIVPEFVQHEACRDRVLPKALELLADSPARDQMLRDLTDVRATLGAPGASRRAAKEILEVVKAAHA